MEKLGRKVYCELCKRKTNHGVIYQHSESGGPPDDIRWDEDFFIAICLGCDRVNFVNIYSDESMVTLNPYEQEYEHFDIVNVYPSEPSVEVELFDSHKGKVYKNLPSVIKVLYKEVVKAYNSNLFLLSAIGLRMIVEGICKDLAIIDGYILDESTGKKKLDEKGNEIRVRNLVGKINGLIENGVIVQKQSRILHEIRELGNQTAHELRKPQATTVLSGIEIIESILEIIYELDKFSLLKNN